MRNGIHSAGICPNNIDLKSKIGSSDGAKIQISERNTKFLRSFLLLDGACVYPRVKFKKRRLAIIVASLLYI
jgi:hypothetical protein